MDDRLNKSEWLRHGLQILALEGFSSLKAAPLAKSLNVSRGSFYWHFKDIAVFRKAVLELWRENTTLRVIDDLSSLSTAKDRLRALISRAGRTEFQLERAVRAWATQEIAATEMVRSVDDERIAYIQKLLIEERMTTQKANVRAQVLYWAYLGQSMTKFESGEVPNAAAFDELFDLVLS